jgi:hypothetical protein
MPAPPVGGVPALSLNVGIIPSIFGTDPEFCVTQH